MVCDLVEMQKRIKDFCQKSDIESSTIYRLLDLNSELGELAKEILLQTNYGKKEFDPVAKSENLALELGDVMFSLICLANSLEIDLASTLEKVLIKYQKRIELKSNPGSRMT